jgi:hypothetical protein
MTHTKRTIEERIIEADERGGRFLADANEAAERGNHAKAERLYEKGQYWLDVSNKLRGCGE